jgi:small subunit ribosomal protein S6
MNTYEAFTILKPILDVDNSDNVLKTLETLIENLGGKISKKEKLGRKRLAYEIMKFKDGFFVTYQMSLDPATISQLYRAVQLNEDILRFTLVSRTEAELNEVNNPPVRDGGRDAHRSERGGFERGGDRGAAGGGDFRPRRESRA